LTLSTTAIVSPDFLVYTSFTAIVSMGCVLRESPYAPYVEDQCSRCRKMRSN
jgi:hypothetical protein